MLNRRDLTYTVEDAEDVMLSAASGQLDVPQIAAWLLDRSASASYRRETRAGGLRRRLERLRGLSVVIAACSDAHFVPGELVHQAVLVGPSPLLTTSRGDHAGGVWRRSMKAAVLTPSHRQVSRADTPLRVLVVSLEGFVGIGALYGGASLPPFFLQPVIAIAGTAIAAASWARLRLGRR